ncbi:MAG: DUF4242 domain-containing protein [Candidatus Solibacter sp.]
MPKYVIEREMPQAGQMPAAQLKDASQKSSCAMQELGHIHWVQSYVTDNKIYCVYVAPNEEAVRAHAAKAGLPVTRVEVVRTMADAATGE